MIKAVRTRLEVSDTTSTKDRWNLAAVEVRPVAATGSAVTYRYDSRGNLTKIEPSSGPATTLSYNQANQLVSYENKASYTYNGDGLRMSKTVDASATAFTWDSSGSVPLVLAAGTTYYIYDPGGEPIEQIHGTTPTYLLADQQGSTRLLINSSATIIPHLHLQSLRCHQ